MNAAGSIYDAPSAPPLVPQSVPGTVSGGVLRPGSIDQGAFVQMLQQEQQNRAVAGVGGKPVSMPSPAIQGNIPTLSSAQFAVLVGNRSDGPSAGASPGESPGESGGAATDPQAAAQDVSRVAAPTAAAPATTTPKAPAMQLTGRAAQPSSAPAGAEGDGEAPTFQRVGETTFQPSASAQPATASDAAASDAAAAGAAPDATKAAAASKPLPPPDPNVVHLKDAPDRETQRNLMAAHKRWIVDETPGSRQLFFGPDGQFGWDDFLDVINPLQHIPIVAQIYRAVTGDKIYGAADLIGSLPLGPIGIIGTMATVANLAVKDTTGKDIGDNLEAMVFGDGTGRTGTGGTAADSSGVAEATPAHPDLGMQTASAEPLVSDADAARQAHDQRKA
jgi:hypothetical protein